MYSKSYTEPEQKFFTKKFFKTIFFIVFLKFTSLHIREVAIHFQNVEAVVGELSDLKFKPNVCGPN